MDSTETARQIAELQELVRQLAKAQTRAAKLQNGIVHSLTKIHLAAADLIKLNFKIRQVIFADDRAEMVRLSNEAGLISDEIFNSLTRSLEHLSGSDDVTNSGEDS